MNATQLPLAMRWPAQQRFASFAGADNAAALASVRDAAAGSAPAVFVSGPAGSGKTHLLIGACAAADEAARAAQYVSLGIAAAATPQAIRALGGSALLAIDDVDAIAAAPDCAHALFDLYNRCRAEGTTLLFAATAPPAQLGLVLPDLASRLASCTQAVLRPLGDAERREVVRARAAARGVELDDVALDWLFTHTPRDLASLVALVERIDRASLAAQRRITVPFLRTLIAPDAEA